MASDSHRNDTKAEADPLASLKSLLLGDEQHQIEHLSERMDDPKLRAEELAEILPKSISISDSRGTDLSDALENTIVSSMQNSIQSSPQKFADALYPVMGPAIRQSISNTMKELVDHINRTLEHSLSIQGLKWRFEAMRNGLPFAEVILRNTLAYRVEQVFLIQPRSGLLMQHVSDERASHGDADAVSGMLTAIAQFARDAFQAGEKDDLGTIEIGEYTVLLTHGPQAYLACAVRGIPPHSLRDQCRSSLEKIHREHLTVLEDFEGDDSILEVVKPQLQDCLLSEEKQKTKKSGLSPAFIILLLLLLIGLIWVSYTTWHDWQAEKALLAKQTSYVNTLREQDGVVLTDIHYGEQNLTLHGMLDPLADSPREAQIAAGLNEKQVITHFKPYLDLSPGITIKRIRQQLPPPPEVNLDISDSGEVSATGRAPAAWLERAGQLIPMMPGVASFDSAGLISYDQHILLSARQRLQLPQDVQLEVKHGTLFISGQAPLSWINNIYPSVNNIQHLENTDISQLISNEQIALDTQISKLNTSYIAFHDGVAISSEQPEIIEQLAQDIHLLLSLAKQLNRTPVITLTGRTDGTGLVAYNEELAHARAVATQKYMGQHGLPEKVFQLRTAVRKSGSKVANFTLRRVDFAVTLKPLEITQSQ